MGVFMGAFLFFRYFPAGAVLSAKVTGAAPVTSRTSLFGRAPLPLATVAVGGRRTAAYSAGIPVLTMAAIHCSRSVSR
jgi:hypothetical protein